VYEAPNQTKNDSNYTKREYIFSYWDNSRGAEVLRTPGPFRDIRKAQEKGA
jgi:hypothetical protein